MRKFLNFTFEFVFSDAFLGEKPVFSIRPLSKKGFFNRLWMIMKTIKYAYFNKEKTIIETSEHKNKIWFYVTTKNQFNAIENVYNLMPNAVLVTTALAYHNNIIPTKYKDRTLAFDTSEEVKWHNILKIIFFTLFYIPHKLLLFGDIIIPIVGIKELFNKKLKRYSPKTVVFSNDHIPNIRALLYECNRHNIKTVYIQHAAVSEYFPKLSFDLSLLEGLNSYEKYMNIGKPKGDVQILGIPRFDNLLQQKKKTCNINNIGICFSLRDNIEEVKSLIIQLKRFHKGNVTLRPHPQDNRKAFTLNKRNIIWSDSKTENAFTFLQHQDIIFSGDSTILLEAVMMNVIAVYCSFFNTKMYDYYGFYKNNVVELLDNKNKLYELLKNIKKHNSDVFLKAKLYNYAIGTDYQNEVSKKYANSICNFLRKSELKELK